MAISPFSVRPVSPERERRRARLVVAIATVGIAATLLAYAISPGVRHAVGHAAHNVKHAVGNVFDHDHHAGPHADRHARLFSPLHPPARSRPAGGSSSTGSKPAVGSS